MYCSKSAIETVEEGVKYFKVTNAETRTTSLLLTLNIFLTFLWFLKFSIDDFAQLSICYVWQGHSAVHFMRHVKRKMKKNFVIQ